MIEFYEAYRDYRYLMDYTEELLRDVRREGAGQPRPRPTRARRSIWPSPSTA